MISLNSLLSENTENSCLKNFVASPELPELSLLLNDLENDCNENIDVSLEIRTRPAIWGEHVPSSSANATEMGILQCILGQMQQLIKSQIVGGAMEPVNQTLAQLNELVNKQQQILSAQQCAAEKYHMPSSTFLRNAWLPQPPAASCVQASNILADSSGHNAIANSYQDRAQPRLSKRVLVRNKKFGALQTLLAEKKAQADALEAQNEILKRRQKMLNIFIKVRDLELQTWRDMQIAAKTGDWNKIYPAHPLFVEMPVQKLPNVDEVAWRRFLENFVDELSRLLMLTKSQQQQQQDCDPPTAADVKLESELFPMAAGTLPEQSTYTASPPTTSFWSSLGHLEASSHDPILDCSLDFLSDTGLALSNLPGEAVTTLTATVSDAATSCDLDPLKQLEYFFQCVTNFGKCVQFLNPDLMHSVSVANEAVEPFSPQHWKEIVESCKLSHDQRQDALMMERLLWEYNSKVYAERQCLVHSLDQKVQSWQQSTKSVADSMKEVEHTVILDQLKRNILHDRCLNFLIIEVFFFHILDVVQRATIIVSTCPRTPSKMAIIHNILEQIKLLEAL